MKITAQDLPLGRLFMWENEAPDKTYMVQPLGNGKTRNYSWKDTANEARRMAAWLQKQGFDKGSKIAILSKNCAEFILADLAIWMAGYVSVAIYPTLNADTVNYVLTHSEAKLLFVGKLDSWDTMKTGVAEGLPQVAFTLAPANDFPKWGDIIANTEPVEGSPQRDAKDESIIVYTSGSTGQPKGVLHNFYNMAFTLKGLNEFLELVPTDRFLSYLPLAHVFERAAVEMGSIYSGATVYFAESLDTFLQDIQRARPTLFQSVPRLWLKFQLGVFKKIPPEKLDKLLRIPILKNIVRKKILTGLGLGECRIAVSGSAPIPPNLIDWYRRLGLELLEGYGMSENFVYSHFSRPGKSRVGYVGHADPEVECKIADNGEILVKSPANMLGYYKKPDATAESFTDDGYLKTGDRGEIDEQGRLKITGRVKELFKSSKGKYIAPAPIENLIASDHSIETCCVTGSGHPQPYALLMLSEDLRAIQSEAGTHQKVGADLAKLLAKVNGEVEHHEQLQFFVVVKDEWQIENGFLTPTMKIKRNVVEDSYGPQEESWYASGEKIIWES